MPSLHLTRSFVVPNASKSGDYKKYTTFEMVGRGGFSKLGPDGDWAEAVSLGGMIVVSHGMCIRSSALEK